MSKYGIVLTVLLVLCLVMQSCNSTGKQTQTLVIPLPTTQHPVDILGKRSGLPGAGLPGTGLPGGLHHVVAFTDSLYSGAVPDGELGFATLKAMGIKTIISVDGAPPELAYAQKYGLRYVHLPIGYDGVPRERQLQIARAVRDLPGKFYIHCHHGKHRSAAATAAVSVTLGLLTVDQALKRMRVCGTSPHYQGLFNSVAQAVPASKSELDNASDTFPQIWQTPNLVDAMVAIDQAKDHLKAIQAAGWKTPVNAPDLVPASEAARLADLLQNLKDDKQVREQPQEMTDWLLEASAHATVLEHQLLAEVLQNSQLDVLFNRVRQSCKQCHAKYRD